MELLIQAQQLPQKKSIFLVSFDGLQRPTSENLKSQITNY